MNILLDTYILLWALSNDDRLPEKARELIENTENRIYYSLISLWEVELKRLTHPDAYMSGICGKYGFYDSRFPDFRL